jgi:hypothetical protein
MVSITSAEAIVGAGLSGDRYCAGVGFYSPRPTEPGAREVTLIEVETWFWKGCETVRHASTSSR